MSRFTNDDDAFEHTCSMANMGSIHIVIGVVLAMAFFMAGFQYSNALGYAFGFYACMSYSTVKSYKKYQRLYLMSNNGVTLSDDEQLEMTRLRETFV